MRASEAFASHALAWRTGLIFQQEPTALSKWLRPFARSARPRRRSKMLGCEPGQVVYRCIGKYLSHSGRTRSRPTRLALGVIAFHVSSDLRDPTKSPACLAAL